MSLRQFSGFKGSCAFAQVGEVQFAILAPNARQLGVLWQSILTEAGPLDAAGIQSAVLVSAADLPVGKVERTEPKATDAVTTIEL